MTTREKITEYFKENEDYLGDSAQALSYLDDSHWPSVLLALDHINTGAKDPGIDCELVITAETINDFDDARLNHWHEKGSRQEYDLNGFKAVKYTKIQLRKNQPRINQIILDLGEKRLCLV